MDEDVDERRAGCGSCERRRPLPWRGDDGWHHGVVPEPEVSPALRWLRASVVAGVAATLGAGAHLMAGGLLPSAPVLTIVSVALLVISAAALGRPASYRVLAGLVVGGQAMVHLVLTAAAGHQGPHAASPPSTTTQAGATGRGRTYLDLMDRGAGVGGLPSSAPAGMPHWLEHLRDDVTGPNLLMSLTHLAAAAMVAGWLCVGERALWALVTLLGRRLAGHLYSPSTTAILAPAGGSCSPASAVDSGWSREQRHAVCGGLGRRGPPRLPVLQRLSASPSAA